MQQKSGRLIISDDGKLMLTGEIFDSHGSFDFNAYVDTGQSFNMSITKELADAVCAEVVGEQNISIGGGSHTMNVPIRKANFRFGNLLLQNYNVTVINGNRNLVGINFFQDNRLILVADFNKEKTMGGIVTNDRKFASIIGKTSHCYFSHNNDISKSNEPCPICGAQGE